MTKSKSRYGAMLKLRREFIAGLVAGRLTRKQRAELLSSTVSLLGYLQRLYSSNRPATRTQSRIVTRLDSRKSTRNTTGTPARNSKTRSAISKSAHQSSHATLLDMD